MPVSYSVGLPTKNNKSWPTSTHRNRFNKTNTRMYIITLTTSSNWEMRAQPFAAFTSLTAVHSTTVIPIQCSFCYQLINCQCKYENRKHTHTLTLIEQQAHVCILCKLHRAALIGCFWDFCVIQKNNAAEKLWLYSNCKSIDYTKSKKMVNCQS